jgi:type II secretory pathway pseudopilin PulG
MHTTSPRGFTLLELIVSVGLFMIVVTIAASAYLSMISLNRKAMATNDVVSNLSFVMESMSRSIRTGSGYDCGGVGGAANCWSGGSSAFSFTSEDGLATTYLLRSNATVGVCVNTGCSDSAANSITDPRVTITGLTFYVQGVGTGDSTQPRVLITLSGSVRPDPQSDPVTFTIQTSATQRLIEL